MNTIKKNDDETIIIEEITPAKIRLRVKDKKDKTKIKKEVLFYNEEEDHCKAFRMFDEEVEKQKKEG